MWNTRYAGAPEADTIWESLHQRLNFGKKRLAVDGWTKFCGRFERQDPETLEMFYCMDEYYLTIPFVEERTPTKVAGTQVGQILP